MCAPSSLAAAVGACPSPTPKGNRSTHVLSRGKFGTCVRGRSGTWNWAGDCHTLPCRWPS
eukprot:5984837-Heterocapsa_arctica.AAC.1